MENVTEILEGKDPTVTTGVLVYRLGAVETSLLDFYSSPNDRTRKSE